MNEQLQETINELLVRSMEAFNAGADWLAGEIPDVISQLLWWNALHSLLGMLFGIALLLGCWRAIYFAINEFDKPSKDQSEYLIIVAVLYSFFGGLIGIPATIFNLDWLKIWIAPKLYLLEYAADLIK